MIRIDSVTQSIASGSTSNNKAAISSTFADLLTEQVTKLAETGKSKQEEAPAATHQVKNAEETNAANPRDELMRLLAMSPAELIRYQMLDEMGLTEESLQGLPYEERMKIEKMIEEEIERQLGGKAGVEDTGPKVL